MLEALKELRGTDETPGSSTKKRVSKKDRLHLSPGKSVSLMELPSSSSADQPPGSSLTRQPVPTGSSTPTRGKRAAKPESTKSRKTRTKNTVLNSKQEAPKVLAVQDSTREGEVPVELEVGGYFFVN